MAKAYRETTPTRERICINGLWRWQPAETPVAAGAGGELGLFQGPRLLARHHRLHAEGLPDGLRPSELEGRRLGDVTAAWYQREIAIPADWAGRRIAVSVEYLNSYAAVYVDGTKAGEIRFPGGEVDLTLVCRPGGKHMLSLLVVAMPLKGVMLSYKRHRLGPGGQGLGGPARPVRRCLPGRARRPGRESPT